MGRCDDCMKNPVHPDKKCCFNCARVGPGCEVWHHCGEDCTGWKSKVVTNADKIRAMSDEEMCNWLFQRDCTNIAAFLEHGGMGVMDAVQLLDWLQQPAE